VKNPIKITFNPCNFGNNIYYNPTINSELFEEPIHAILLTIQLVFKYLFLTVHAILKKNHANWNYYLIESTPNINKKPFLLLFIVQFSCSFKPPISSINFTTNHAVA
jgi:hypothetical protein